MLERIREGAQGPWAMIVVALIVLSFVFAGVGSYLTAPTETAIAKVNGEDISARELENAYENERARLENQFGEGISALFANSEYLANFREEILDRIIDEKLVEQKAVALGLRVSDEQIKQTIVTLPEFQVGGQFSNERYQQLLRQNGLQPSDFVERMRISLTKEQLGRAIAGTDFVGISEAQLLYTLEQQTRDATFVEIDSALFVDDIAVTEEQINQYYQTNIERYDTQEQTSIAYVEIKVSDLIDDVVVTEEEVTENYQFNVALYTTEERRRVSHILFESDDQQTANAVLARLQNGEDFADLAEEFSVDTFSGENGGDLDYIALGDIDPVFDEAAFALSAIGDLSDLVVTESGIHIIQVTDIIPEVVQTLDDVRDTIVEEVRLEKANERFFELQTRMAELAFEIPESLDELADAVQSDVKTTALFTRASVPAQINHPRIVENAFSQDFIAEAMNSDVIEINDDHVLVMRPLNYEPQRTRQLDEVREEVVAALTQQLQSDAAQAFAQRVISADDAQAVLDEKGLSFNAYTAVTRASSDVPPAATTSLFTLSQNNRKAAVTLPNGNAAVIELVAVNDVAESDQEAVNQLQQQLGQQRAQSNFQAFVNALRDDAEIVILN